MAEVISKREIERQKGGGERVKKRQWKKGREEEGKEETREEWYEYVYE